MGETDTTRVFFKVAGILSPKEFKKQVEAIMSILNWIDTSLSLSLATGYGKPAIYMAPSSTRNMRVSYRMWSLSDFVKSLWKL